jgi:4-carboxymuconolactone decarboxylase
VTRFALFNRRALVLSVVLLLGASVMWAQQASQPAATTFTGPVSRATADGVTTGLVIFEPGSRTYWHSHPNGQLLMPQKGRMRTQRQGGPVRELGIGEPDYTAPNVRHWHGATPKEQLTQLTVGFGGTTKWEEEVTEQQYQGKK